MGLLDRFRKFDRPAPPERVTLAAIGWVRNDVGKPRPRGWEKVESHIDLLPGHAGRLRGLEEYSHVIVVFYTDLAADAPEKPESLPVEGVDTGILATRSQLRPNHLGVSAVPLLGVEGAVTARPRPRRHRRHARARPQTLPPPLRRPPGSDRPGRVTRSVHPPITTWRHHD